MIKVLVYYFKGKQCSACLALLPKVEQMLKKYPNIELKIIDVDNDSSLAASFNIFSVPAVIACIDNKVYIQQAGIFSIQTLEEKIQRLYELLY